MTALFWAAGISAFIVAAFLIGYLYRGLRGALAIGFGAALFWLLWTFGLSALFVGYALSGGLQSFQIALIFVVAILAFGSIGAYHWNRTRREDAERQLSALRQHVESLAGTIGPIELQDVAPERVLKGAKEHRAELLLHVRGCKHSLVLLSGWLSDFALDRQLKKELERAAERGVEIRIGWGYRRANEAEVDNGPGASWLRARQHEAPRSWKICYFRNHSKLLVRDDAVAIIGSFNWLSNKGSSQNDELSLVLSDPRVVQAFISATQDLFEVDSR